MLHLNKFISPTSGLACLLQHVLVVPGFRCKHGNFFVVQIQEDKGNTLCFGVKWNGWINYWAVFFCTALQHMPTTTLRRPALSSSRWAKFNSKGERRHKKKGVGVFLGLWCLWKCPSSNRTTFASFFCHFTVTSSDISKAEKSSTSVVSRRSGRMECNAWERERDARFAVGFWLGCQD